MIPPPHRLGHSRSGSAGGGGSRRRTCGRRRRWSRPLAPCYNGIAPFNPYIDNCAIPNRPPRVLGSAPDQTAILNCSVGGAAWRAVCLSQFVNGGPYPGIAVGIG